MFFVFYSVGFSTSSVEVSSKTELNHGTTTNLLLPRVARLMPQLTFLQLSLVALLKCFFFG